jgi:hypothetical protein
MMGDVPLWFAKKCSLKPYSREDADGRHFDISWRQSTDIAASFTLLI